MVDVRVVERHPATGNPPHLPALVRGLGITMRHFFANLFGGKKIVTIRYPEQRAPYPIRFRGLHRLMVRADGTLRCVACMLCPTVCPSHCITVIAEEVAPPVEKRARLFEIDQLRCIACGLCVEACPTDALRMDTGVHVPAVEHRAHAIFGMGRLGARGALSTAIQGGEGT